MAWQKPSLAGESLSQRESRHCPRMGLLARTDAPPHLAREPIPLGRPSKRPSRWENRPPRLSPSPVLIRSFMDVRGAPVVGSGCHVNDRRGALPWQRPAQQGREPGTDRRRRVRAGPRAAGPGTESVLQAFSISSHHGACRGRKSPFPGVSRLRVSAALAASVHNPQELCPPAPALPLKRLLSTPRLERPLQPGILLIFSFIFFCYTFPC